MPYPINKRKPYVDPETFNSLPPAKRAAVAILMDKDLHGVPLTDAQMEAVLAAFPAAVLLTLRYSASEPIEHVFARLVHNKTPRELIKRILLTASGQPPAARVEPASP